MPVVYEYHVEHVWAGFWGGWGSESRIQDLLNRLGAQGWRLTSTKTRLFFWFIFPRPKLLLFFERTSER